MGCDYFYEGSIKDRGLQKEAIDFIRTYFDHIKDMLILNHLEGVHLPVISRFAESLYGYHYPIYPIDYPFNFYGIIPFYDPGDTWSELDVQAQFVFNRHKNGRLVTLDRIPEWLGLVSYGEFYPAPEPDESMVICDGGNFRTGSGGTAFPLMLYALKYRYCHDLDVGDDYNTFLWVMDRIEEMHIHEHVCRKDLGFNEISAMFDEAYYETYPSERPEPRKPLRDIHPHLLKHARIELSQDIFSLRTCRFLARLGLRTVGDLAKKSMRDLCDLGGLGVRQFREIEEFIKSLQYK